MLRLYRKEHADLRLSAPSTPLEVVKIGLELLSSDIAVGTRLGNAENCECDSQATCKAADAKLAKACINTWWVFE